jgi:branched-chain amino acid transport system substrate-binding protein
MKKITIALGVMAIFLFVLPWNSLAANPRTVKVGFLVPITGIHPDWGKKQVVGLEMALEKVNAAGGVNGMPIQIVQYDTGSDPAQSASLLRKLAETDKVLVTIGPFYSVECEVVFPLTTTVKVPVVGTASSKPGLSDLTKNPYAFRMTMTEDKMASAQFRRWISKYGVKTTAIIYDAKDATASIMGAKLWPPVFQGLGLKILNEKDPITFNTGDVDFSAQVTKLKTYNPDGICISALPQEAGRIVLEIRRQGLKQPLISQNESLAPAVVDIAGEAAEDFWSVGLFYVDDANPKVQAYLKEFRSRCQKKYPGMSCDPEQFDVNVHDILHFLVDIMKKRGISNEPAKLQEDREKIREGLVKLRDWPGTAGAMSFDEKGDGIRTVHILRVKNGKWQPVD